MPSERKLRFELGHIPDAQLMDAQSSGEMIWIALYNNAMTRTNFPMGFLFVGMTFEERTASRDLLRLNLAKANKENATPADMGSIVKKWEYDLERRMHLRPQRKGLYRLQGFDGHLDGPRVLPMVTDILKVPALHRIDAPQLSPLASKVETQIPFKDFDSLQQNTYEQLDWMTIGIKGDEENKPYAFQCVGRDAVLDWYRANPIGDHVVPKRGDHRFITTCEPSPPLSSVTPWEELANVTLGDLHCYKRHLGKAITCRILTKPKVAVGITFVVEDTSGSAIPLSICYPFRKPAFLHNPQLIQRLYPIGAILRIREPRIQPGSLSGLPEICVGIPTDCIQLPNSPQEVQWAYPSPVQTTDQTAAQLKDQGNLAFMEKEYSLAINYYSLALKCADFPKDLNTIIILLLNRAQAYLDDQRPGSAYRDCIHLENIITSPSSSVQASNMTEARQRKLLWRKLMAAYKLRLFDHATTLVTECKRYNVQEAVAIELRLSKRRAEREGQLDLSQHYLTYKRNEVDGLDMNDFIGPVEVRNFGSDKGRGTVLTQEVKAGEILLVEKAVISTWLTDALNWDGFGSSGRLDVEVVGVCVTAHKLIDDPSLRLVFDNLHPGNTGRASQIRGSETSRIQALTSSEADTVPIDMVMVWKKFSTNAFTRREHLDPARCQFKMDAFGHKRSATHLFATTSILNHSCIPNTAIGSVGDVIVVKALHDMPAGTELYISYISNDGSYQDRQAELDDWKFTCHCHLCRWDRSDDSAKRINLMSSEWSDLERQLAAAEDALSNFTIEQFCDRNSPKIEEMERVVKSISRFTERLAKTYCFGRRVKVELASAETRLARSGALVLGKEGCIDLWRSAFRHCGIEVSDEPTSQGIMITKLCAVASSDMILHLCMEIHRFFVSFSRFNSKALILLPGYTKEKFKAEMEAWGRTIDWVWDLLYPTGGGKVGMAERIEREKQGQDYE